jgi:hypothetical protein
LAYSLAFTVLDVAVGKIFIPISFGTSELISGVLFGGLEAYFLYQMNDDLYWPSRG